MQDTGPAQALRFYACAISASALDFQRVCHDSAAQSGAHNTAPPPILSAPTLDSESGDSRLSVLPPLRGLSLRDWLEKLADARRKWMVATYRFSSGKQSVDKSRKRDDRRQTYESARAAGSPVTASDKSGRQPPWGGSLKHTIIRAADFCRRCDSMVEVELEYAAEGVFVAERRKKCPVCNNEEQLRGSNKVGTQRSPRADSDERFEVGRDWRRREVNGLFAVDIRNVIASHCTAVLVQGWQ